MDVRLYNGDINASTLNLDSKVLLQKLKRNNQILYV